jgi:ribosomal protein S18 acetylase RimI-like enzyme
MLVAVRAGELVGLLESDRLDATRSAIWKLYVAPHAQRRGVGRALVEAYLATDGMPEVRLEHDERNAAAAAFFDAAGFAVDAVADTAGRRTVRRVRRLGA